MVQQWLFIYGHDVPFNGELDEKTKTALAAVDEGFNPSDRKISSATFVKVYVNIPMSFEATARQQEMVSIINAQVPVEEVASESTDDIPAPDTAPALADKVQPASGEDPGKAATSASVETNPASPKLEADQPTLAQQPPAQKAAPAVQAVENVPPKPLEVEQKVAKKPEYVAGPKRTGIGKFLTEEDW